MRLTLRSLMRNIDKLLLSMYYIDDKNVSINMRLRARAYNINVIILTYFFTTRRRTVLYLHFHKTTRNKM